MSHVQHKGKYDLLRQNAQDLARKGLIPDYTLSWLTPDKLFSQAINETKAGSRSYRCRECGLETGSKDLMRQHVKTHFKGEIRENETDTLKVSPY